MGEFNNIFTSLYDGIIESLAGYYYVPTLLDSFTLLLVNFASLFVCLWLVKWLFSLFRWG